MHYLSIKSHISACVIFPFNSPGFLPIITKRKLKKKKKKDKMNTQKVIKSIIINCLQMHLTSINFLKSKSKKNKIDSKMFSQEKQRLESS